MFHFFYSIDFISKKQGFTEFIEIPISINSSSFRNFLKNQTYFCIPIMPAMKRSYLMILTLTLALTTACGKSEKATETEENLKMGSESIPGNYGAEVKESDIMTTSQMVTEVMEKGTFEGKISGEIKEVCVNN